MRLEESSEMSEEEVAEYNRRSELRQRFEEHAILLTSLCRELAREEAEGKLPSERSQTAFGLLQTWIRNNYVEDGKGRYLIHSRYKPGDSIGGIDDLEDIAPELVKEIRGGWPVSGALEMVYSAGIGEEYRRDVENLRQVLLEHLKDLGTV